MRHIDQPDNFLLLNLLLATSVIIVIIFVLTLTNGLHIAWMNFTSDFTFDLALFSIIRVYAVNKPIS